jgi:hypothetical protein
VFHVGVRAPDTEQPVTVCATRVWRVHDHGRPADVLVLEEAEPGVPGRARNRATIGRVVAHVR